MNPTPFQDWENGVPPLIWLRALAMDVGGATPNALEWVAVCPETQSLVCYDEVNMTTTDMRAVAQEALPKMKQPGSQTEYKFIAKVGDYENRIALDDMSKHGIRFTNAVKHNKTLSVHRLAAYLHPNERRPFPTWHPRAGELGAPLLFITSNCKHAIDEIPQQKWKNEADGSTMKDELDRSVRHDAVDCLLYITRIMPAPVMIPIPKIIAKQDTRSLQSKLYWADVKRQKEQQSNAESRKRYNPAHGGGTGECLPSSLLGFSLPS